MAVTIKSQREIELMRESCKILADVFSEMEKAVHPGYPLWISTTWERS